MTTHVAIRVIQQNAIHGWVALIVVSLLFGLLGPCRKELCPEPSQGVAEVDVFLLLLLPACSPSLRVLLTLKLEERGASPFWLLCLLARLVVVAPASACHPLEVSLDLGNLVPDLVTAATNTYIQYAYVTDTISSPPLLTLRSGPA